MYGKIRVQFCSYTGKYGWEKARILAQCYAEVFLPGFRPKSACLKIARYKEVSAIKKVHYREVLPCDEFIILQFSINRTYERYFDRNSALFNFCILVINGVNLISRYKKVVKSWFNNYCSGRSCNILKGGFLIHFSSLRSFALEIFKFCCSWLFFALTNVNWENFWIKFLQLLSVRHCK